MYAHEYVVFSAADAQGQELHACIACEVCWLGHHWHGCSAAFAVTLATNDTATSAVGLDSRPQSQAGLLLLLWHGEVSVVQLLHTDAIALSPSIGYS